MHIFYVCFTLIVLLLGGCRHNTQTYASADALSRGSVSGFASLPDWNAQKAVLALEVFKKECARGRAQALSSLCKQAAITKDAKHFFETRFVPMALEGHDGKSGLMTGYYEPLLHGSTHQSAAFPYPLYAPPDDLLHIELSDVYPDLKHRFLRGRLRQGSVEPYPTRAQINANGIDARPLCYLSSDIDRFFLHVQGSGRIAMEDHSTLFVGHADRNGWPYVSIGKKMVEAARIRKEDISMQSIRAYLKANKNVKRAILESNPSYIFFKRKAESATGSLGVALTPMLSIAVDRTKIPLGFPVYYDAIHPVSNTPLRALAFAQDTGSAIIGQVRADLFWGFGTAAESAAGQMKSPLRLWLFLPREPS